MGIKIFSDGDNTQPPMPNPSSFETIKLERWGSYEIIEVCYPQCTTFNGNKLLLLRKHSLGHHSYLDPHLLGNDHIVMARFEPTEEGWKLARLCVKNLEGLKERQESNKSFNDIGSLGR